MQRDGFNAPSSALKGYQDPERPLPMPGGGGGNALKGYQNPERPLPSPGGASSAMPQAYKSDPYARQDRYGGGGGGGGNALKGYQNPERPLPSPGGASSAMPQAYKSDPYARQDRYGATPAPMVAAAPALPPTPEVVVEAEEGFMQNEFGLWVPRVADVRTECPHCNRKFSEGAAARHIPKCKEVRRKPTNVIVAKRNFKTDAMGRRVMVGSAAGASSSGSGGADAKNANNAAAAEPRKVDAKAAVWGALETQWAQVQILLQKGIDAVNTEAGFLETMNNTQRGLEWVRQVESYAQKWDVNKGKLSRMLLPFRENTDAQNQANINKSDNAGSPDLDKFDISREARVHLVKEALNVSCLS